MIVHISLPIDFNSFVCKIIFEKVKTPIYKKMVKLIRLAKCTVKNLFSVGNKGKILNRWKNCGMNEYNLEIEMFVCGLEMNFCGQYCRKTYILDGCCRTPVTCASSDWKRVRHKN